MKDSKVCLIKNKGGPLQAQRQFRVAKTTQDLESFFPVIKELRPHLSFSDYLKIYDHAHRNDGYEMVALVEDQQILGVVGYRFISDFVRGLHIYIDDLVVSEKVRSQGLGLELLQYAEKVAKESNCTTLRLCAALENERGIRFYDRNNWTRRAYAYVRKTL